MSKGFFITTGLRTISGSVPDTYKVTKGGRLVRFIIRILTNMGVIEPYNDSFEVYEYNPNEHQKRTILEMILYQEKVLSREGLLKYRDDFVVLLGEKEWKEVLLEDRATAPPIPWVNYRLSIKGGLPRADIRGLDVVICPFFSGVALVRKDSLRHTLG